jgi:hypothetical protein
MTGREAERDGRNHNLEKNVGINEGHRGGYDVVKTQWLEIA